MPKGGAVPDKVIQRWRAMDRDGVSRVEIARAYHTTPSMIARKIGAKQIRKKKSAPVGE